METYVREARRSQVPGGHPATSNIDDVEDAAAVYLRIRPSLVTIAYRILGNASEAEDVLQEVWLRLHRTDGQAVHSPSALLRTITVRVAINVLHSARRRREYCATPWLPEGPDPDATPEAVAERQDAVERAVALLLETMTPRQRAAYILREGFGYPYDQIAGLLDLSVVNARQQVTRAQRHLVGQGRRRSVDSVTHRRLVHAFLAAAQGGDLARLEQVLLADVDRPRGASVGRTADA
ncbi:RNA polymerase sigma factor (sigma-70 family) [Streptomyces phaeoluteigriseus]